jgi:hypothetical protein
MAAGGATSKKSAEYKGGKEDRLRRWIFSNLGEEPMTAQEVTSHSSMTLAATSNVLREMCEDGILSRNKNSEHKWQYRMLEWHDPDEYIQEIKSRKIRNREVGALKTCFIKERKKYLKLKEQASKHTILVACECGRNLSIQVKAEVIGENSTEACEEISRD